MSLDEKYVTLKAPRRIARCHLCHCSSRFKNLALSRDRIAGGIIRYRFRAGHAEGWAIKVRWSLAKFGNENDAKNECAKKVDLGAKKLSKEVSVA